MHVSNGSDDLTLLYESGDLCEELILIHPKR